MTCSLLSMLRSAKVTVQLLVNVDGFEYLNDLLYFSNACTPLTARKLFRKMLYSNCTIPAYDKRNEIFGPCVKTGLISNILNHQKAL